MADFDDDDLFADDEAYANVIESEVMLEAHILDCQGKFVHSQTTKDMPFKSIIRSGGLNLAFANPNHFKALIEKTGDELVFFKDYRFHAASAFIENLEDLFQMARKRFVQLEKDALKPGVHQNTSDYFEVRENLCFLFEYLTSYLQSLQSEDNFQWIFEEQRPKVAELAESLSILIQGLTKIEYNLLLVCPDTHGNKCKLPMYHLLHLHLELRWHYLCLLNAMSNKKTETNRDLEGALDLLLTELLKLAEGVKEEDYGRSHPFLCTCIRQFWLLLQIFADKLHSNGTISQPFWSILRGAANKIFSPAAVTPSAINKVCVPRLCQDWTARRKASFSLWLFVHLSFLYGYNEDGIYVKKLRGPMSDEGSQLLELLLKKLVPDATEDGMREVLICLMQLPEWWNIGMPVLNLLLDHYTKNMNSLFLVTGENLANFAIIAQNAPQFNTRLQDHLSFNPVTLEKTNSYHLFLKFLASQMKNAWSPLERQRYFKQVKGRICTKFNPGRVAILSDMGIYNLASLCLTMGLVMELDEMGAKLQGFLGSTESVEPKKKAMVMLSHMTLIFIRAEKNLDISETLKPVVLLLNNSCKEMNENNKAQMDLMKDFVDSLNDVACFSNNASSATHLFLGPWLLDYLKVCHTPRASKLLCALLDVASNLPIHDGVRQSRAVESFRSYLMPYVVRESSKIEPAAFRQMADIVYSVTAAADDMYFSSLFQHYGLRETVHVGITSRYLSQLVTNDEVRNRLKLKIPNYKTVIVQAWIRCCVFDESNGLDIEAVTREVCFLPEIVNLLGDKLAAVKESSFPLKLFGRLIGSEFASRKNDICLSSEFKRKVYPFFEKLPGAIAHVVLRSGNNVSRTEVPSSVVMTMYQSIGELFMSCPTILYTKSNPKSTLHLLVNTLLIYEDISKHQSFTIDANIKAALQLTFHKFLIGLGKLMHGDDFVKRIMTATVKHFVHSLKAPRKSDADNVHATKSLHPIEIAFRSKNPDLVDELAKIFGTQLLKMKGASFDCEYAPDALRLLQDVEVEYGEDENLITSLVNYTLKETLLIIMEYHNLQQNDSPKELAFRYFKAIVNTPAFKDNKAIQDIFFSKMSNIYKSKVAFQAKPLFSLLMKLASFKPKLLIPTLPDLHEQISKVEKCRNTQSDKSLREPLRKLEDILFSSAR